MHLLSAICIQVLATRAFTASWWRVTRCLHVTFQYTVDATDFLGHVVSFGQYANEKTGQFSATPHKMWTITRRPPCIRNNYRYSLITNFCKTCAALWTKSNFFDHKILLSTRLIEWYTVQNKNPSITNYFMCLTWYTYINSTQMPKVQEFTFTGIPFSTLSWHLQKS